MEGKPWPEKRLEKLDFNGQSIGEKIRANPAID